MPTKSNSNQSITCKYCGKQFEDNSDWEVKFCSAKCSDNFIKCEKAHGMPQVT